MSHGEEEVVYDDENDHFIECLPGAKHSHSMKRNRKWKTREDEERRVGRGRCREESREGKGRKQGEGNSGSSHALSAGSVFIAAHELFHLILLTYK